MTETARRIYDLLRVMSHNTTEDTINDPSALLDLATDWKEDPDYGNQALGPLAKRVEKAVLSEDWDFLIDLGKAAKRLKSPDEGERRLPNRSHILVSAAVLRAIEEHGEIPTTKQVADDLGVSVRTVQRSYERLAEKAGLLLDGRSWTFKRQR